LRPTTNAPWTSYCIHPLIYANLFTHNFQYLILQRNTFFGLAPNKAVCTQRLISLVISWLFRDNILAARIQQDSVWRADRNLITNVHQPTAGLYQRSLRFANAVQRLQATKNDLLLLKRKFQICVVHFAFQEDTPTTTPQRPMRYAGQLGGYPLKAAQAAQAAQRPIAERGTHTSTWSRVKSSSQSFANILPEYPHVDAR